MKVFLILTDASHFTEYLEEEDEAEVEGEKVKKVTQKVILYHINECYLNYFHVCDAPLLYIVHIIFYLFYLLEFISVNYYYYYYWSICFTYF